MDLTERRIEQAGLSPREAEAFRLICNRDLDYKGIAHELKIATGTASCMLTRIKAKLEAAEAERRPTPAQMTPEEQEEADRRSIQGDARLLVFLLRVMRGPRRHNPAAPLIGRTHLGEYAGVELVYSDVQRLNIGCPVTAGFAHACRLVRDEHGDLQRDYRTIPRRQSRRRRAA